MSRLEQRSLSQTTPSTPSPPKPVPALHGSLSLPYARNPSGTDSIIDEPSVPYLSQIWGIKSKITQLEPGGSSSKHWLLDAIPSDKDDQREKEDREVMAKENRTGVADLTGPLASGSRGKRNSGGKKVVIMDDPNQMIGRRRAGSGEGMGPMGLPLRGEMRGQNVPGMGKQQDSGRYAMNETGRSQPATSRSTEYLHKPIGPGYLSTSTSEPVLAALAFQAKLLSPEKPKYRQSLSPRRSTGSESASQPHVIDGYGPPQPPTVSPISAERKAAILAADKRKREQAGGGRSPGKSPSGKSWGQGGSPGRGMLMRGDDGGSWISPMKAKKEVDQVSPGRPERSKSWAERTAIQADKQQRLIERLPSTGGTASVVEAKMRYSPAHGKWIAVGKLSIETDEKAVQQDRAGPKVPPIDFVDPQKNPFLDPPTIQSKSVSTSPAINTDDLVQRPRSPYDFSHLQGSLDAVSGQMKMGQYARLGLGRPGLANVGSVFGGSHVTLTGESILASLKKTEEGGTINDSSANPPTASRAVMTPIFKDKLHNTNATLPECSSPTKDRSHHDNRRIVSEPALATQPDAVTSGFASFMSNTRIVSDPLPANKGKKWLKKRKGAKPPAVEDWSALKQKFVAGETTQDYQKVDKAVRQVADAFTKTLPKSNKFKTDSETAQHSTTPSSAVAQNSTADSAKRDAQHLLHQTLHSRIMPVATHRQTNTTTSGQDRDARYVNPRNHPDKKRNNDAQQYRGRIRSDKSKIRSSWTPARERKQNDNDNDQTYSIATTGHALPNPKSE